MQSKSDRIRNIASKLGTLPTIPTVVSKMIELADNPKTKTETLSKLISNDPALTARILKSANSAYYGLSQEVSTVETAIVVIGRNAVKEMGLSLSIFDAVKNMGTMKSFDIQEYWEHSIKVGTAAKIIAKKYSPDDSGELYTAGLLHDFGKLVLIQYMPQDFYSVLEYSRQKNIRFFEAEQEILGITHSEIGYIIAERWNLPPKIGNIIRFHHSPAAEKNFAAQTAIINAADMICNNLSPAAAIPLFDKSASFNGSEISELQKTLLAEIEKNDLLHH